MKLQDNRGVMLVLEFVFVSFITNASVITYVGSNT